MFIDMAQLSQKMQQGTLLLPPQKCQEARPRAKTTLQKYVIGGLPAQDGSELQVCEYSNTSRIVLATRFKYSFTARSILIF